MAQMAVVLMMIVLLHKNVISQTINVVTHAMTIQNALIQHSFAGMIFAGDAMTSNSPLNVKLMEQEAIAVEPMVFAETMHVVLKVPNVLVTLLDSVV